MATFEIPNLILMAGELVHPFPVLGMLLPIQPSGYRIFDDVMEYTDRKYQTVQRCMNSYWLDKNATRALFRAARSCSASASSRPTSPSSRPCSAGAFLY